MSDLLWPGDERAGDLMSDLALMHAMVQVEAAWLAALVGLGVALPSAADELIDLVDDSDLAAVTDEAELGGTPVLPLVALLRSRVNTRNPEARQWLHLGLTSQDVLDTALQLSLREVAVRLKAELATQITALVGLIQQHRSSVMAGRTLTQHAVPVTFGLKAASWLHGVLDASEDLERSAVAAPGQFGGAAGTLAATTALAQTAGLANAPQVALEVARHACRALGLEARPPWHTARATITRLGDAFVTYTDALGRIANDVLTLARPEVGELGEPTADGRGGSSTMPQKSNPILSVLIRRAALSAPALGAQLHLAAAEALDERPDGAWHTEWATLRTLARRTVVASGQATELLTGLRVDVERMRANATADSDGLLAEERSILAGASSVPLDEPADYLGANDLLIDLALHRVPGGLRASP